MSSLLLPLLFIAGGLACLVFGADALVRGAAALASRFGVSPFVIGLTVVAFGTSAPELVVGVRAAMAGSGGLVFGNVFGSNVANIGLILALAALLTPLTTSKPVRRETLVMLGATALVSALLLLDPLVWSRGGGEEGGAGEGGWTGALGRVDGLVILGLFALYMFEHVRRGRTGDNELARELAEEAEQLARPIAGGDGDAPPRRGWIVTLLEVGLVLGGLALLVFGGEVVVSNATHVARRMGVEDRVIGVTIVAIGTSLPELAAALMAAYRKHGDMILGNVIGSNIFNLMLILGVSSLVAPLEAPARTLSLDLPAMAVLSVACAAVLLLGKSMSRASGVAIGVLYACYLVVVYLVT